MRRRCLQSVMGGILALILISVAWAVGFWDTKAPVPAPRSAMAFAESGGLLYLMGGSGALATNEAYDPVTDTWSSRAAMPTPRSSPAAGQVGGTVYVTGGANGGTFYAVNEAYDPVSNTWSTLAPMPTARQAHTVAVAGGLVYVIGGLAPPGGSNNIASVLAYDPVTNTWTARASMPTPRRQLCSTTVGGIIYAIGGWNGAPRSEIEAYDPATNTWSSRTPMPTARSVLACGVIAGKIYVVGGVGSSVTAVVEVYDPATDTWTTDVPMPTARGWLAAGVIGNILYAAGGSSGAGDLVVNESFPGIPPNVSITCPADQNVECGVLETLSFGVDDLGGESVQVEFLVDGSLVSGQTKAVAAGAVPTTVEFDHVYGGPAGTTFNVEAKATNASGEIATCSLTVTVVDTTPPVITCSIARTLLWPARNGLVPIGFSASAQDGCEGSVPVAVTVFSDEDHGSAPTAPDAIGTTPATLRLRMQRAYPGDGRVYIVRVMAQDGSGNVAVICKSVVVPVMPVGRWILAARAQASAGEAACRAAAVLDPTGPLPGYFDLLRLP